MQQRAALGKGKGSRVGNGMATRMSEGTAIRAMEGEGNERKFILSFSSEEPYKRFWGTEILDHTPGAVDLSRLNEIGVVLYNHDRDRVVGKIYKAWIEENRGYAEVEFDTDAESEVIYQKVKSGTLKGVSVGYKTDVWEEVATDAVSADGRFKGPCEIAKRWVPLEVSIVSIPADATVGVGRGMQEDTGRKLPFSYFERQLQINKNKIL